MVAKATTTSKAPAKTTKTTKTTRPKKDPNAPKKPLPGFMLYLNDNRSRIKQEHPGITVTETSKVGGKEWKTVKPAIKKKYQDLADLDKERYEKEMANYVPDESFKKMKKKKDPNAPKKNTGAYLIFTSKRQKEIKKKNPDMKQQDIISQIGAEWRGMTEDQKKPYFALEEKDRKRYQMEMEKYQATKQ
jgi:hypothetical protein